MIVKYQSLARGAVLRGGELGFYLLKQTQFR